MENEVYRRLLPTTYRLVGENVMRLYIEYKLY